MKYHGFNIQTKTKIVWNYAIDDHPIKGYLDEERGLYFHLIPKNASSFLAGNASNLGWKQITAYDNLDFKKGLIVIRDPVYRWISGIFEFFYVYNLIDGDFENNWKIYKNLLLHNPIVDGHTSPQEEFLYNLDLDKFSFVFLPEAGIIGDKVQRWLSNNGFANELHKYAKENEAITKTGFFNAFRTIKISVDSDQDFKNKLKEHFKASYSLIDWINQNEKWI